MIHLQLQPIGSNSCGQHCIAMITGKPVSEVIKLIGHDRITKIKDLINLLRSYGLKCEDRLTRIRKDSIPETCILRVLWPNKKGHWVVYHKGEVYCPWVGVFPITKDMYQNGGRFTSYLEVKFDTFDT